MRVMGMRRAARTAVLLALVATSRAWAGDPVWTVKAPMPTPRQSLMVAAIGGTIYAVGGRQAGGAILGTVEAYDTATDSWTTKAILPVATQYAGVSAVGGILYIIGGNPWYGGVTATVFAYDTATDIWTTRTPKPAPSRVLQTVAVDGKIYALGGNNLIGDIDTVEVFDPAANAWAARAPMPMARRDFGASVLNGMIYTMGGGGGFTATPTVEAYDSLTDTWSAKANLPASRADMGAATVGGLVYSVGGQGPSVTTFVATVDAYNPSTNTWVSKTPMPTARDELGVAVVGCTIYAIGGGIASTSYSVNEQGILPPGAMSATLVVSPATQHVGRWFTVTLTVADVGDFALARVTPALAVAPGTTLVSLIGGPSPPTLGFLPPGWTQVFSWTFSVSGVGIATFTATVTGFDLAGCSTLLLSSSAIVPLQERIPEPPNPLVLTRPGAALDRNVISLAHGEVVLARIAPRDATPMTVRIYTASGRLVRTLRTRTPLADGQWLVAWDGRTEDEMPVSRGVYVIRVTGGGLDERLKLVVR